MDVKHSSCCLFEKIFTKTHTVLKTKRIQLRLLQSHKSQVFLQQLQVNYSTKKLFGDVLYFLEKQIKNTRTFNLFRTLDLLHCRCAFVIKSIFKKKTQKNPPKTPTKPTIKPEKYTFLTLFPIFTTIKTTAVCSVTCMIDTVNVAWILAVLSIGQNTF